MANAQQAAASRAAATATIVEQFEELAEALALPAPPERVECFDISHTQGGETVASCVVFNASGPVKSDYRRFNIREVAAGDDYGALAEPSGAALPGHGGARPIPIYYLSTAAAGSSRGVCGAPDLIRRTAVMALQREGASPGERLYRGDDTRPLDLKPDSPPCIWCNRFVTGPLLRDYGHRAPRPTPPRFGTRGYSRSWARRRRLLQHFGGL